MPGPYTRFHECAIASSTTFIWTCIWIQTPQVQTVFQVRKCKGCTQNLYLRVLESTLGSGLPARLLAFTESKSMTSLAVGLISSGLDLNWFLRWPGSGSFYVSFWHAFHFLESRNLGIFKIEIRLLGTSVPSAASSTWEFYLEHSSFPKHPWDSHSQNREKLPPADHVGQPVNTAGRTTAAVLFCSGGKWGTLSGRIPLPCISSQDAGAFVRPLQFPDTQGL